jgi:hypothetical protein
MRAFPWIVLVVAFALRAVSLLDQSFSLDEGYSALFSRIPISSIFGDAGLDSNPPLGNAFFHIWCGLVRYEPALMRLPGVLASVASLCVVWRLLSGLLPERSLLFVLVLKAVSLYDILYARQLRIYPFAEISLLLSWLFLRQLVERPSRKACLLWGIFSALACQLHYFCLLVVAATCLMALAGFRARRIDVLKGCSVIALLVAPLAIPLYQQLSAHRSFGWIAEPGTGTLLVAAYQLCGHSLVVLALAVMLIISAAIIRQPETGKTGFQAEWLLAAPCVAIVAAVVGIAAILSFAGGSFFHPRYFFFLQVPFLCLVSLGLSPFSPRAGVAIALGTAGAALVPSLGYLSAASSYPTGAQVLQQVAPNLSASTLLVHRTKCSFSVGQLYDKFRHGHRLLQGGGESNVFSFSGLPAVYISQEEAGAVQEAVFVSITEGCPS